MAHATWHHSSPRSQEQQFLLSSLKLFYKPASITTTGPNCNYCSSQHHHVPPGVLSHITSCASLPLLGLFSRPPRRYQVHSLQILFIVNSCTFFCVPSHQKTLAHFYCRNRLLARNNTSDTQCTSPKVPAPHQGCSATHRRTVNILLQHLVLLIIANADAILATSALLPGPFVGLVHLCGSWSVPRVGLQSVKRISSCSCIASPLLQLNLIQGAAMKQDRPWYYTYTLWHSRHSYNTNPNPSSQDIIPRVSSNWCSFQCTYPNLYTHSRGVKWK